mmetsp:Transcript_42146/g.126168  ORF Transcript_42146/g.126168 Transcript_42146/m.126168 type:complete len:204 (+) Transcript_42146:2082-2693(+)
MLHGSWSAQHCNGLVPVRAADVFGDGCDGTHGPPVAAQGPQPGPAGPLFSAHDGPHGRQHGGVCCGRNQLPVQDGGAQGDTREARQGGADAPAVALVAASAGEPGCAAAVDLWAGRRAANAVPKFLPADGHWQAHALHQRRPGRVIGRGGRRGRRAVLPLAHLPAVPQDAWRTPLIAAPVVTCLHAPWRVWITGDNSSQHPSA